MRSSRVEFFSYALPTFFVMSGFLITRVLWMCRAETLWGRLRTFYLRRIIRIVPAYAFVLALLLIFDHLQNPASYIFYYLNIKLFLVSLHQELPEFINWWGDWDTQDLHLWSVAVEEQFYILFPFVYFLVPARHMGLAFALTVAVGLASRRYFMHYYRRRSTGSCSRAAWSTSRGARSSPISTSTADAEASATVAVDLPAGGGGRGPHQHRVRVRPRRLFPSVDVAFHRADRAPARLRDLGPVDRRPPAAARALPQLAAVRVPRADQLSDVPDPPDVHRVRRADPRRADCPARAVAHGPVARASGWRWP